jgi:folate-binding protein YgfZ
MSTTFIDQYTALTSTAGFVDVSDRTQLEFTGADRTKFLHNLCTSAVQNLSAGAGCEAFILNVKGHIVGHVSIFAGPHSHILETVPAQAEKLLAHFDRYRIREDVEFVDRSPEWFELLLAGPRSTSILVDIDIGADHKIPNDRLSHTAAKIAGAQIWLRKIDWISAGAFLIAGPKASAPQVQQALINAGAIQCRYEALEAARIEHGTPMFDRDITDQNLPQEIARDQLAISFTKGCYLGQETVARIDALGHVNRLLRGVRFAGKEIPTPGLELHAASDGSLAQKSIGRVTSACWSPSLESPLALAFVNRGHHDLGSCLESDFGPAEVVQLPIENVASA